VLELALALPPPNPATVAVDIKNDVPPAAPALVALEVEGPPAPT
jgi:hypothetical protein